MGNCYEDDLTVICSLSTTIINDKSFQGFQVILKLSLQNYLKNLKKCLFGTTCTVIAFKHTLWCVARLHTVMFSNDYSTQIKKGDMRKLNMTFSVSLALPQRGIILQQKYKNILPLFGYFINTLSDTIIKFIM